MQFKIAGIMTVTAIALKLLLFLLNLPQQQMALFTIFVLLFIVLAGTFFAVRKHRTLQKDTLLKADFIAGMRVASLFAILFSVFVLVYYNKIDTHYFHNLIEERVNMAIQQAAENPKIDLDSVRKTGEMMFTPRVHASLTLFGLMTSGAVYSLLISMMMRRISGFK